MEHINQFNKGINSDTSNIFQPKDTARELKHWVQLSEDGDTYSLVNEQGCIDAVAGIPSGFKIIGHTILDRDILCVLAHQSGYSQVGIIDYSGTYTRKVPSNDIGSQLGFTIDNPVDCVAKRTYGGDRILYYTDNNIPFGSVNLDTRLDDDDLSANSKLIKDINAPLILASEFREGGNLYCGVYQFSIRYINEDGSYTNILGTTNVIPVTDEVQTDPSKDGDTVEQLVSKSIVLRISNIDTNYKQYQLILHRENNAGTVMYSYAQPPVTITDTNDTYIFSGNDSESEIIDIAEVRETSISYNKAKCIEQIDNRLVLGNLTEGNTEYNEELQNIANNIVVKYKVREEVINETVSPDVPTAFNLLYGYRIGNNTIKVRFSDSLSTSTTSLQFTLIGTDSYSNSTITITDVSALPTETLTIGSNVFTFTATETGNPFDIYIDTSGSITDAGNNIRTAINVDSGDEFNANFDTIDTLTITYKIPTASTYTFSTSIPTSLTLSSVTAGSTPVTYTGTSITINEYFATVIFEGVDYSTKTFWTYSISNIDSLSGSYPSITEQYQLLLLEAPTSEEIDQIIINNYNYGYKDEFNTTYRKGYKRDEVYSLALVVKFKDGSDSYAYHIPGNNLTTSSTTSALPVDGFSGTCGTYVSSIEYPLNQNLPGTDSGDSTTVKGQTVADRYIRHHKMPSLEQCTHLGYSTNGNETVVSVRILGLECEFTVPFSSGLASSIQSYSIVRESREKEGNKSIICQGFGMPTYEYYTDLDSATGVPESSSKVLGKSPFFGQLSFTDNSSVRNYVFNHDNVKKDIIQYYSPELTFGRINPSSLEGKRIFSKIGMQGSSSLNPISFKQRRIRYYSYNNVTNTLGYYDNNVEGSIWTRADFYQPTTVPSASNTDTLCTINKSKYIEKQSIDEIEGYSNNIDNSLSTEFFAIKTETYPGQTYGNINIGTDVTDNITTYTELKQQKGNDNEAIIDAQDSYDLPFIFKRNILEVDNPLDNQYGTLDNTEYIEIHTSRFIPTSPFTETEIYGGDIFISMFSVINKNVLQSFHRRISTKHEDGFSIGNGWDYAADLSYTRGNWSRSNTTQPEDREPDIKGYNIKVLYTMYLESTINCNFRHEYIDDSGTQQTRYYPKSSDYDTLKVAIEKGECNSYNTQYSLENSIKPYYAKSLTSDISGDFKNRIIYSDNAPLDSVIDNYRQFPVNNYQDTPKHTGEIWDLFVLNDIIYAHTPKSLWRLYSKNNTSIQTTDISEVVLGTGDAFTIDANQNYRFEGGYAGSISQFAGVHTPSGYIFPDILQGKIFVFNGQGLQELSRSGILSELANNMKTDLVTNTRYYDNPYTGYGLLAGYDFRYKRYLITKHDSSEGFTYSYSFIGNCWLSKHDYKPNCYITNDDKFYLVDNDSSILYIANKGDMCDFKTFTNGVVPSSIKYIVNPNTDYTKVFDNLVINSNSYDSNNVYQPYDSFDTIKFSNDLQSTDIKTIIISNDYITTLPIELQSKFKNNEYRLSIPRGNNEDRLKSKYLVIDLVYNNNDNYKLLLNYLKTIFRINYR